MKSTAISAVLLAVLTIGNCQWVLQNHTHHVVNMTYVQPGYGGQIPPGPPGPPGFIRNVTGYQQPGGYINQPTGVRNGNDLLVGTPGPYDVVLFKEWFTKGPRWLQIREKIIQYPTFPTGSLRIITAIQIIDLAKGPGGFASILTGGVGLNNVTIRLYSERSRGFNYKVVIYGR